MALTKLTSSRNPVTVAASYEPLKGEVVHFTWSTTDATASLPVKMYRVFDVVFTAWSGASAAAPPATDEFGYVNADLSKGGYTVGATGTVPIARTGASKTSGLQMVAMVFGV